MRRSLITVLACLLLCLLVLPALLVRGCRPAPVKKGGISLTLYSRHANRLVRLDLEEYLIGVLAAEVPANFSPEALKAQAVAARTLTIRRLRRYGGRGCAHTARADLCDQPGDGQAWLAEEDLKKRWGWRFSGYYRRLQRAVEETRGLVLLHDRRPIDAVYHSTCGGLTEDAAAVWGHQVPYLRSVSCGFDAISPRYRTRIRIPRETLARRLGLDGAALSSLRVLARTAGGRVTSVSAGGRTWSGTEFRKAAGLRSTNFVCAVDGRDVVFTVRGNGHGVGLCQYGAEGMARRGAGFLQILRHYYSGVTLGRIAGYGK